MLVATDIAARGIDVEALSHVVNFDVPNVPEDYIHRVGRTARAEMTGDAFTFVSPEEADGPRRDRARDRQAAAAHHGAGLRLREGPAERFEVPIAERIAAIRARKAEERTRAREKAERRVAHETAQSAREEQSEPARGRGRNRMPRGPRIGAPQGPAARRRRALRPQKRGRSYFPAAP